MKIQRLSLLLITVIFLLFFIPNNISAHSGRTDSSGGHNCNVGACAGTYHYHNGGYTAPAPVYNPSTPKPTVIPTPKVTFTPKPTVAPTPTPSPTLSPSPESSPEVQGEQTSKPTQSPSSPTSPDSSSKSTSSQFLGWAGVALFAYLIYKNRKNKKIEKRGGDNK